MKEKHVPDGSGKGNSYTTHYRSYDPRTTRWWSLDPKPTASESWYAGLGNNPILNTDVLGDEAHVGGNIDYAQKNMVKALVDPKYQNRVSFNNNVTSFDINGLSPGLFDENSSEYNSGVTLLNNLVTSQEKYMFYAFDNNNTDIPIVGTKSQKPLNKDNILKTDMYSASISPKFRDINSNDITSDGPFKPINGYSAVFALNVKASYEEKYSIEERTDCWLWTKVNTIELYVYKPLQSLVFHEGWELWEMTHFGTPYEYTTGSGSGCIEIWGTGAHSNSACQENWFWGKSGKPGHVDRTNLK